MPHGKENEWTAPRPERKKQSVSIHRHTIQYTDCPKELPEAARTYVNAARSQDLGKEHLCVCGCTRVVAHAWLHVCGCTCMVAHVWLHVRGCTRVVACAWRVEGLLQVQRKQTGCRGQGWQGDRFKFYLFFTYKKFNGNKIIKNPS